MLLLSDPSPRSAAPPTSMRSLTPSNWISEVVSNGYDENAKKYSCEGMVTLTVLGGTTVQLRTGFSSQRTDDGKSFLVGIDNGRALGKDVGVKGLIYAGKAAAEQTAGRFHATYSGQGEGDVKLTVAQGNRPGNFAVAMSTATKGFTGSVKGQAIIGGSKSHRLNIWVEDGVSERCVAKAIFGPDGTVQLEEEGCSAYHGAACAFSADLKRVPGH